MLIVMPVLNWIFEEALRSAGMVTLALRQVQETGAIHLRALAAPLKDAWKRLWKPSSYALLAYLLILLPLLGAGFISVLELGIAIPPFITGELMKTPALALIIRALHLIALYVALRLSLAVAVFVRTSRIWVGRNEDQLAPHCWLELVDRIGC
jgi:glycerophosphoryl diester phosphodiesterase